MQNDGTTYQFVHSPSPAPVGPVTVETIEYLLQSYEEEGVPEEELQELRTLLANLKSGAATLPEPGVTYYERVLPNGDVQAIYATARLDNPEQALDLIPLHPIAQVQENY